MSLSSRSLRIAVAAAVAGLAFLPLAGAPLADVATQLFLQTHV